MTFHYIHRQYLQETSTIHKGSHLLSGPLFLHYNIASYLLHLTFNVKTREFSTREAVHHPSIFVHSVRLSVPDILPFFTIYNKRIMNKAKIRSLYQEKAALFLLQTSSTCFSRNDGKHNVIAMGLSRTGENLILRSRNEESNSVNSKNAQNEKILTKKLQHFQSCCINPSTQEEVLNKKATNVSSEEASMCFKSTEDNQNLWNDRKRSIPDLAEAVTRNMITQFQASNNNQSCSSDFVCRTCGTPFFLISTHPTKVRIHSVHRRSRTQRRRASRQKSKKLRAESQSGKHNGGGRSFHHRRGNDTEMTNKVSFASQVASLVDLESEIAKRVSFEKVRDGSVKNYVSYTCNSCGDKSLFKGLKPTRTRNQDRVDTYHLKADLKTQTAGQKRKSISSAKEDKPLDLESDFLSLGDPRRMNTIDTSVKKTKVQPTITSLSQSLGKKKGSRKKKQVKKKSALHDFLASLND